MKRWCLRMMGLIVLSAGLVLTTGCDEAGQIVETIRLALGIADVWV